MRKCTFRFRFSAFRFLESTVDDTRFPLARSSTPAVRMGSFELTGLGVSKEQKLLEFRRFPCSKAGAVGVVSFDYAFHREGRSNITSVCSCKEVMAVGSVEMVLESEVSRGIQRRSCGVSLKIGRRK